MNFIIEYKFPLLFAYVAVNLITFAVYGIDKYKAVKNKWRVPESTLILLAVVGGSLGALVGMNLFHHKTKHVKFFVFVPLIFICQLVIFLLCIM